MKNLSVLSFGAAVVAASGVYQKTEGGFQDWMVDNQKNYTGAAFNERFGIWQNNFDFVETHNAEADAGKQTYRVGMNFLADLSNEEYQAMYLGKRPSRGHEALRTFKAPMGAAPPAEVDWRTHSPKVVSPIKDQQQCGSCWAFSAVEAMEAAAAMKTGKAVVAGAPQQLVDCVNGGKDNCNQGGEMHDGYLEVMKEGGLDTEASYRYQGTSGHACRFKPGSVIEGTTDFKGYVNVTSGNETDLEAAVATIPTVSIAIDASSNGFQLYAGGVYNNPLCHSAAAKLDHGVAIVGYGVHGVFKKNYWLVRNSWGTIWGLDGYIMMSKDKKNQCGVATDATYPVYN